MTVRPRIVRATVPPDDAAPADGAPGGAPGGGPGESLADHAVAATAGGELPGEAGSGSTAETSPGEIDATVDPDFDEATYLRAFPDIADAVRRGIVASGLAHFRSTGRVEKRLENPEYRALLAADGPAAPQVIVDTLAIAPSGATLMTGWSDDRFDPLTEITLQTRAGLRHNWTAFPRLIRPDVERTLEAAPGHRFGFMLVAAPVGGANEPINPALANTPVFSFASGVEARPLRDPSGATDSDLRDLALAALPAAAAGDLDPEVTYRILDQHIGVQLAAMNRLIIDDAQSQRLVERFGPQHGRYRGSIITVLRGRSDELVPRLAVVCSGPGAADYEFIVVVTNPDQFEPALRAARLAVATIGLSLTLVLQPGGDPAGTGEEAAADISRSDRLIFMDQSVLPRLPDWALQHSTLLDSGVAAQTRLFGGLLYHPDGSLAHGGYYFAQETSLLSRPQGLPQRVTAVQLKTVTRPAPVASRPLPPARPIAGIPSAFLSVDRAWFEALGGFTRQYCRAVYDDIDLCLRSLKRGVPAWVHPLPLWYFERRAPVRPEPSKGGAILNDWLLHRQWDSMIVADLLGSDPASLHTAQGPSAPGLVSAA